MLPKQSPVKYTVRTWAEDRATRGRVPRGKAGTNGTMPPHGLPGLAQMR